jgi:hypothetical protein
MALLKEVAKTAKLNKETVIRFRCTNNFKQLLDYWVQKTGSNGRSEFIRNLVLVASSENKRANVKMDKILNKEIELRE